MKCFSCGQDLQPVFDIPQRRKGDRPQFVDALHLKFSGGYGEFIDGSIEVTICNDCAKMLGIIPWISKAIDLSYPMEAKTI